MKKRKLFFGVFALGGIFALASCDNEDVNKLKEEISTLKSEKETLTTENTSLKNDKTTLTNENNTLKADKDSLTNDKNVLEVEVDRLSTIISPNKENINCRISLDEFNEIDNISEITEDKDVIVKTYDIDDEIQSIYKISLKSTENIFDKFTSLADVEFTNESWGHYIKSIDGTIKDDKYYLSLLVNDEYSMVGIDDLDANLNDGDVITFKYDFDSYHNTSYDETDIKVDKIIYNYYKHAKEYATKIGYVDYNLAFAYSKLQRLGYDVDTTTLYSNSVLSKLVSSDKYSSDGSKFKTLLAYYCAGLDTSEPLGEYCANDVDVNSQWVETTLAYYYNTGAIMNENFNNYFEFYQKMESITLSMDETSCMVVTALAQIDSDKCNLFDQTLVPGLTGDGFAYSVGEYDICNCSSTAQAILAFGAIGKNIRGGMYSTCGKDMIQVLLSSYYNEEDGLFYDYDGDPSNLYFATPQAVSALISYKLLKAGKSSNIYAK